MRFTKHLFISYTHADNGKLAGQKQGWVSLFHENLETLLTMRLGQSAVIWRDDKLKGNDEFSDEILDQLREVATIVCILSPKYLSSDWCRKEANEFYRIAEATAGIKVGNKSRIIKVIKLPVEHQPKGLPESFGKLTGFPFYICKDNHDLEIDPAYGPDMLGEFNMRSAMIAQDLAEIVRVLIETGEVATPHQQKKGTIFLALTSVDREADRKKIEKELTGRGYAVLPEHDLHLSEQPYREELKKMLVGCDMGIHIIGNYPGVAPSGPTAKSLDVLQYEMALEETKTRGIPRSIWMPDGLQSSVASHQEFLRLLERDDATQHEADVVKGDIEVFKSAIVQALQKLEQKKSNSAPGAAADTSATDKSIYVICTKPDVDATLNFRGGLFECDLEPDIPKFEGDAGTVRRHNDAMLARSGLVVLFYGAGDMDWHRNILIEVQKSNPGARVWTYLAAPETPHKRFLLEKMKGGAILDAMAGPLPAGELDRMLADMPKKTTAAGGQSR